MKTLLTLLAVLAPATAALATPTVWANNGHGYEYVEENGNNWLDARDSAVARGGHLATVTSIEEYDFLADLVSQEAWIGGYRESDGGDFRWVTDEAFGDYSSYGWNGGEPNNAGDGDERYIHMNWLHGGRNSWNDIDLDGAFSDYPPTTGYVVEYDTVEDVPEPAMLGLFGLGAIGIAATRRRKA